MAYNVLQIVVAIVVASSIAIVIYRLTLHPLAKYPGPLLARCTALPMQVSALRWRRSYWVHKLHEEYGDVVRIAPSYLSFRNVDAMHDIYGDRNANVIKVGWAESSRRLNRSQNLVTISDRQVHATRRRIHSKAISDKSLKSLEKYMLDQIRCWCAELADEDSEWSTSKDMSHWAGFLSLDILGELAFSSSFDAIKNGHSITAETLPLSIALLHALSYIPLRPLAIYFARLPWMKRFSKLLTSQHKFRAEMGKIVMRRTNHEFSGRQNNIESLRADFFSHLLNSEDPETSEKLSFRDLVGEAAILVGAGSDTIAGTLSSCLYYLTEHPKYLGKLQLEVRAAFENVEQIQPGSNLSSLAFLRACIDETLRLSPPIPGGLDRLVLSGGVTINGKFIPEGTIVSVSPFALHRDIRHFSEPDLFKPERWIDGLPGLGIASISKAKSAFVPFSIGVRGCIGKNMAYMESLTVIARLVFLFDMKRAIEDRDKVWLPKDGYVGLNSGPWIQFKRCASVST